MRRVVTVVMVLGAVLALAATAAARTPDAVEMERVKALAKQMDMDADEAYVEAVYAGDEDLTAEQTEALQKLYVLKESASYFNEQVAESYEAPEHTRLAFERLNGDFVEARACFADIGAYEEQKELFDTIEDNIGNMRHYYVGPEAHVNYPDFEVYPHYPGYHLYAHQYAPERPYHYRHTHRWHLHAKHYELYPHRHAYKHGYGRHKHHYRERARHHWHRKVSKKIIPLGKPKPVPQQKPKPGPGPGSGSGSGSGGGKGKGKGK